MSNAKWTPGPWDWEEIAPDDKDWGACEITASDDSFVCTHVMGVANARLISAAPDMAEALERFDEIHNEGTFDLPDDTPITINVGTRQTFSGGLTLGDFRRARSALAKARGET